MKKVVIFHNPRCSKSRQTLQLLMDHSINPEIIDYLKTPPTMKEISEVLKLLNIPVREMMRKNETVYKDLNLDNSKLSEKDLISAMAKHPILIERPIVIAKNKAVIARPPEKALELI